MAMIINFRDLQSKKQNNESVNIKLTKEQIKASSQRLSYDDDSDLQEYYKTNNEDNF